MTSINQSSGQGALFELVARGVKDTYFVKDSKESRFPYDARYQSSIHHLAERRTEVPINGTTFGNTFEVEIDPSLFEDEDVELEDLDDLEDFEDEEEEED